MVKKMTMEDGTRYWFSCDSEPTRESRKKILYFEWREYILRKSIQNFTDNEIQYVFVRVTHVQILF